MRVDVADGLFSSMNGAIDVTDGSIAQPACRRVVFLMRYIAMYLTQQLERFVQVPGLIGRNIDIGMIVDVFAVVDRRALDLTDRRVDLGDGHVFVGADRSITGAVLQHPAGRAQIRQRVQIVGMFAGQVGIGEGRVPRGTVTPSETGR